MPPYRRRNMTDAEMRVWLESQYDINEKSCWVWKNRKDADGYVRVQWHGKMMRVHRLYWLLSGRTIPAGLEMCHGIGCSKACFNPEHLRADTRSANMLDRHADGTAPTKLSAEQVRDIRLDPRSSRVIADAYGVAQSSINNIKLGKRWSWLV